MRIHTVQMTVVVCALDDEPFDQVRAEEQAEQALCCNSTSRFINIENTEWDEGRPAPDAEPWRAIRKQLMDVDSWDADRHDLDRDPALKWAFELEGSG